MPASGRPEAQRQIDLAGRELGAEGDPETAHFDISTGNTSGKIAVVEFRVGIATSRVSARALYYMASFAAATGKPVPGILVAGGYH